jgi:protein-tyrosine phosphatase
MAMHPASAGVLLEIGADPHGFRSRRLTPEHLHAADLVLTASRSQRAACVGLAPAVLGRAFTILQFCRLAAAVPPDRVVGSDPAVRLAGLLDEVHLVRAELPPSPPAEEDLADPVNGTVADFRACRDLLADSLGTVVRLVMGA